MPVNPSLKIHARLTPKLNFAAHQNGWAGLTELNVESRTPTSLDNVELTLATDPPIIRPRTWRITRVPPLGTTAIEDRRLDVDADRLRRLGETITTTARWEARVDGEIVGETSGGLQVLAANEWGGTAVTPALLAAFCTPNNPAVDTILGEAADILRRGNPEVRLEGYAHGQRTAVWNIAQAVYAAIANRHLAYSTPPASFETNGQKIRLPDRVLETRVATCLDSALLMAAALEQAKLNPFIALPKDHALVGVWLTDQTLPGPFTTDPEPIRKRADLQDLVLIETTLATEHPAPPFTEALKAGRRALNHEADSTYAGTVDIQRARQHGIRPLALDQPAETAGRAAETAERAEPGREDPPTPLIEADAASGGDRNGAASLPVPGETPDARVDRWLRQLLDLSLRNPLLNYRAKKSAIPITCPDPGLLEDKLAAGKRIRLDPRVEHPEDLTLLNRDGAKDAADRAAREALEQNRLTTDLDSKALETQTVDLYRRTRTALEEGGANTLYLMLGFLRWRREPGKGKHLLAPLVLIPVTLERASARARMYIVKHDDEPRFNTTLLELLHQDYKLDVQGLDGPLPADEHGVHVGEIWNRVRRTTVDTPNFEVIEDVSLGNASFAKYLMWKDLRDRREALRKSPVVTQLLDSDLAAAETAADDDNDETPYNAALYGGTGRPAVPAREIDSRYGPAELLTPLPADGSQTAAVADAHEGRSFVLVGPPGTGKSQTIANLIAHYLGNGKTVLFASEKTAALNVVHHRVKEIGLDAHCLELHSNKSRKTDVIAQLDRAWNPLPGAAPPPRSRRGRPPRHAGADATPENADPGRGRDELPLENAGAAAPARRPPETAATTAEAAWRRESDELVDLRKRLNDVPERLHLRRRNGLTPYEAIGLNGKRPELARAVKLHWAAADEHSEDDRRELHELAERLGKQAEAAGGIGPQDPVRRVQYDHLPPDPDHELRDTARAARHAAEQRLAASRAFRQAVGLADTGPTAVSAALREKAEYQMARAIAAVERSCGEPDTTEPWIGCITAPATPERLYELKKAAEKIRDEAGRLSAPYHPDAWKRIDGNRISAQWRAAEARWWPARFLATRRIKRLMVQEGCLPVGTAPDVEHDAEVLEGLRTAHERTGRIRQSLPCELPGWTPDRIDPLLNLVKLAWDLEQATGDDALYDTRADTAEGRRDRARVAAHTARATARGAPAPVPPETRTGGGPEDIATTQPHRPDGAGAETARAAKSLVRAHERLIEVDQALKTVITPETRTPTPETRADTGGRHDDGPEPRGSAETAAAAEDLLDSIPKLRTWRAYRRRRTEAEAAGLRPLVDAIDAGRIRPQDAAEAFDTAYAAWWCQAVIAEDPVLREFSTPEQERNIDRFRELDEHYRATTAKLVAFRVREAIPARDGFTQKSEWGVLAREIQKKRRHKSVRALIEECPNAVRRLAPCLLMSPLSVAQYLDPGTRFDVVILDEASQITACDAVGVLARAAQVIVAGDPKQMPPSNFFARQSPADDEEDSEDLESILDDLLASGMPTRHLHMHYRSRCESLIAFSNARYYGEKLVTFPSRATSDHALKLVRPDGYYARGGARDNEGEAKAVVAEVVRRLTHENEETRRDTIGVIAVNSQQQKLIEDLLDRERGENPAMEWAFGPTADEPVFVKNIETVQGDERDVILFSVTYGPDRTGRVSMNFGPLNRDGGERRLNVALTRARREMMVFSTLNPDQIDLSRTNARAIRDLKHFLQFAEHGPQALERAASAPLGDFESPLEEQIAAELAKRGWTVHPQIGVSGYRIDLGVVDPDNPGRYVAGIEADGAMYHSAAGARERDKIRQAALEARRWTMLRVWSTDWWADNAAETAKLDAKLKTLTESEATTGRVRS